MSIAAYRIRKAIQGWHDASKETLYRADMGDTTFRRETERTLAILRGVLEIVDAEVEAEAERHFTEPIKPNLFALG